MNIQETISYLQSSIKLRANKIKWCEDQKKWVRHRVEDIELNEAEIKHHWKYYHRYKEFINTASKQQKIEKSLYKLMLNIAKASPNGSISLYQIREM